MNKNIEENLIRTGYKDIYYSYKLTNENEYYKLISAISNLRCSISYCYVDENNQLKENYKVEFANYLDSENMKNAYNLKSDLEESLKEFNLNEYVSATLLEDINLSSNTIKQSNNIKPEIPYISIDTSTPDKLLINFCSDTHLGTFVNNSVNNLKMLINANNDYINITNKSYNYNFLFQPLKILVNDEVFFINIHATLYPTGNLILHYSIPLRDIPFSNLYYGDKNIDYPCLVPEYIYECNDSFNYVEAENIEHGISMYNKYIFKNLKQTIKYYSSYTLFILNDYSNMPSDFKNTSPKLCRDFYWLVNAPYGYLNEQEKDKYLSFYSNRYTINNFSSLFVGSNGTAIIAFNKQQHSERQICEMLDDTEFKYITSIIYINFSLEMLLLKQSFYKDVFSTQMLYESSLKELTQAQKKLLEINTKIFTLTFHSFGSVKSLLLHMETSSYDFLPITSIESIIKNNRDIIQIKESENQERRNSFNSIIAIIVALFFGLGTIDSITLLIDNTIPKYTTSYISHFNNYSLEIWLFFTLIIFIILYRKLFNKLFIKFKNLFILFKKIIYLYFSKLRNLF